MDINKFKSVAVRKPDYDLLQGLCNKKFRSPASMISKLVREYVQYQAKKNKMSVNAYCVDQLNVGVDSIVKEELNGRSSKAKSNNSKVGKKLRRNSKKSR